MPQGKLKAKAKRPFSAAAKKSQKEKGSAFTRRANAPVKPKKPKEAKKAQAKKLQKVITKAINENAEEQLRAIALDGKKSLLSKKGASPSKGAKKAKKSRK